MDTLVHKPHRAFDLRENGTYNDHREEVSLLCRRTLLEARGKRPGLSRL